jgi:hypothetical protein
MNHPADVWFGDLPDVVVVCDLEAHGEPVHVDTLTPARLGRESGATRLRRHDPAEWQRRPQEIVPSNLLSAAFTGELQPASRTRRELECVECGDRIEVRDEKLWPAIEQLARHNVTQVTLRGLRGILAP